MSLSDQNKNEEEIIKQLGESLEPLSMVRPTASGSLIDQFQHDIKDRIDPSPNLNNNLNNNQPLFKRPFTLTKSRSFSILTQKEDEPSSNNFLSGDDDSNFASIYVTHFSPEKKNLDIQSRRGLLTFDENNLIFLSEDDSNDLKIPLIGHIESALMPHPSNFQSGGSKTVRLLSLTYLPDIKSITKFLSIYFAADQKILRPFLLHLISRAQTIQREQKFKPPSLKIINAPDFLNHVNLDISNNQNLKKNEEKYLYKNSRLPPLPKARIMPKIKMNGGESSILKDEDTLNIRKSLPIRYQSLDWNLLFKLSTDGCSYLTFYRKIEEEDPIIFLLLADSGERIGAYLPTPLKQSPHYYGSGESFVFQLDPDFSTYKWSKLNQFFVSSTKEEFSIGGGGKAAIWIDGYFNKAFSEECTTFNSPRLTQNSHLTISEVEVWKIGRLKKNHATNNSISHRY